MFYFFVLKSPLLSIPYFSLCKTAALPLSYLPEPLTNYPEGPIAKIRSPYLVSR